MNSVQFILNRSSRPARDSGHRVAANGARRAWWIGGAATAVALALDLATKQTAIALLASGPQEVGFSRFGLIANSGGFLGFPVPVSLIVGATAAVLLFASAGLKGAVPAEALGYGLFAGGALGNLADRLIHRAAFPPHAVVDWVAIPPGPTFNLADLFLVVGVLMLLFGRRTGRRTVSWSGS